MGCSCGGDLKGGTPGGALRLGGCGGGLRGGGALRGGGRRRTGGGLRLPETPLPACSAYKSKTMGCFRNGCSLPGSAIHVFCSLASCEPCLALDSWKSGLEPTTQE